MGSITDLPRGALVQASRHLDPEGANVPPGTLGVVFEEANYHNDGGGPVVRWVTGGMCNIYDGDALATINRRGAHQIPALILERDELLDRVEQLERELRDTQEAASYRLHQAEHAVRRAQHDAENTREETALRLAEARRKEQKAQEDREWARLMGRR